MCIHHFIDSTFSSSKLSIRVVRAYPLMEIRQTVRCRAIRGKSSDSRQQYLSQPYPPPSHCCSCAEDVPNRHGAGPAYAHEDVPEQGDGDFRGSERDK